MAEAAPTQANVNNMANEMFGMPAAPSPAAGSATQDADDDLYATPTAQAGSAPQPSAVAAWQATKDVEITKIDSTNQDADQKQRSAAQNSLNGYYDKLRDAQTKRASHNKEVEAGLVASMESSPENKWEHVVTMIDFNRSDLHKKDATKMKSLLLRLKH